MRILVVEDEPHIAEDIAAALKKNGYVCDIVSDGRTAWFQGDSTDYALVILDLGLPWLDGLTILKRWRENGRAMPVLILTARSSWGERVEGMDSGADDYLSKPFNMDELMARVRALLRRSHGHAAPLIQLGSLALDESNMRVLQEGRPVALTLLEYRLVSYLIYNQNRIVPQNELCEHVYDYDSEGDNNALEAIVSRVRRKLGRDVLHTRRGFGYYMGTPAAEPSAS